MGRTHPIECAHGSNRVGSDDFHDEPRRCAACDKERADNETFEIERAAKEIIGHIDTMYPAMWSGVTKNARRSLRGCVINTVRATLLRLSRSENE